MNKKKSILTTITALLMCVGSHASMLSIETKERIVVMPEDAIVLQSPDKTM